MEEEIQGEDEIRTIFVSKPEDEEEEQSEVTEKKEEQQSGFEDLNPDKVLDEAHALINTFSHKLGSRFQLDNSVARDLLQKITSSRSSAEALHQLDQLVVILEDLLAELNAVTLIGRYKGNTPVLVTDASDHTVTVFDSHELPLEDEELHLLDQQSTHVKQSLIDFASRKLPDLALAVPSNT